MLDISGNRSRLLTHWCIGGASPRLAPEGYAVPTPVIKSPFPLENEDDSRVTENNTECRLRRERPAVYNQLLQNLSVAAGRRKDDTKEERIRRIQTLVQAFEALDPQDYAQGIIAVQIIATQELAAQA